MRKLLGKSFRGNIMYTARQTIYMLTLIYASIMMCYVLIDEIFQSCTANENVHITDIVLPLLIAVEVIIYKIILIYKRLSIVYTVMKRQNEPCKEILNCGSSI